MTQDVNSPVFNNILTKSKGVLRQALVALGFLGMLRHQIS